MIKLSIIVPVYNYEKFIKRCLDSLINQDIDAGSYEIIVVDDGSIDNSREIAREYEKSYPNVRLLCQENQGVGRTRNSGINAARGKFIQFIDSDDYLRYNSLGKLLDIANGLDLDILKFNFRMILENEAFEDNPVIDFSVGNVLNGYEFIENFFFNDFVWNMMIRRDFLVENKILFESIYYFEDGLFNAHAILSAKRMAYCQAEIYRWVFHQNSLSRPNNLQLFRKEIEGGLLSIGSFNELLKKYRLPDQKENVQLTLKIKREALAYMILKKIIEVRLTQKEIKHLVSSLKSREVYPLKNFPSKEYPRLSTKLMVKSFNYKWLFLIICFLYKLLYPFIPKQYILKLFR